MYNYIKFIDFQTMTINIHYAYRERKFYYCDITIIHEGYFNFKIEQDLNFANR